MATTGTDVKLSQDTTSGNLYKEENQTSKLWRKTKEAPFVPMGIGGMIGAVGWGIYKFRHKGDMSTSVYLMHLRVAAQGMVVGAITLGMAVKMVQSYFDKQKKKSS